MKKFPKFIIGMASASLLACAAFAAQAEGAGPGQASQKAQGPRGGGCSMMERGHGMMQDPAKMAARMDQYTARMKKELKITEQQEPLWQAFAEQKKKGMSEMAKSFEANKDVKLTAPERMDQMGAMMKAHLEQHQASAESFKRLYNAFSPEQKAIADKYAAMHGAKGKRMGPRNGSGKGPADMKNAAPMKAVPQAEGSTPQQK